MKYPTVSVNGVSVRVDEEGRYNLNDLHAAAVANGEATESQRPSNFLRSAQVKRFISALKAKAQKRALEEIQPLKVINGGYEAGRGVSNCLPYAMQHGLSRSSKLKCTRYFEPWSAWGSAQCPV